ncbi:hypothetical protein EMIT0P12_40442 [Pseudomonas sp. IT-P12]
MISSLDAPNLSALTLAAIGRSQEPPTAADKLLMRYPVTNLRSVNPAPANTRRLPVTARYR